MKNDDEIEMNEENENEEREKTEYDEDGNPIPKDKEEQEPEDPIPESEKPLTFDIIRTSLSKLNRTYDGKSYAYTCLNISEKEIDELGDSLKNYIHIRDLNISKNKIPLLRDINQMTYLVRFDGRENEIRDIDVLSDPDKFKHLQLLYLNSNKIKVLPAMYADNLLELHIEGNRIQDASLFVGLPKVRIINLQGNKLKNCHGIANCPQLELLKLNENVLTSFIGMENLDNLKSIELAGNQFEVFDFIPYLPSLINLDMTDNKVANSKEWSKIRFPKLTDLRNTSNPSTDETGAMTKIEMLIQLEGLECLKLINEEEVLPEDIEEAKIKKEERLKQEEEERIEAERLRQEKEEEERLQREEEERLRKEEEERLEMERLEEEERKKAEDGDQGEMEEKEDDDNNNEEAEENEMENDNS